MIEWLDWWLNSEELGRTMVGSAILSSVGFILATVTYNMGSRKAHEILAFMGFGAALVFFLSGFGAIFFRVLGWVFTGE